MVLDDVGDGGVDGDADATTTSVDGFGECGGKSIVVRLWEMKLATILLSLKTNTKLMFLEIMERVLTPIEFM